MRGSLITDEKWPVRTPDSHIVGFGRRSPGTTVGVCTPCGHGGRSSVRERVAQTSGSALWKVRNVHRGPVRPTMPDGAYGWRSYNGVLGICQVEQCEVSWAGPDLFVLHEAPEGPRHVKHLENASVRR
jgi:hypothetical protein